MKQKDLAGSQYSERSEWSVTGGNALGLRHHICKSAWRAVPWLFAVTILLVCCSCGSQKTITQTVTDIRKDTVYINAFQQDSVYIYENKLIDRSRDTIYIRDKSIEFRYKKLTDTIRIVQSDSIPYEVTVTEVKEIQRPLTFFDKLCRACFWFLITCLTLFISHRLRK